MGNVNLFFFCYRTETPLLLSSVAMAHKVFGSRRASTHILYEASNPLSYDNIQLLKETFPYKTYIAPTFYNRNRNQHGQDCIQGMVKVMKEHTGKTEIAVKIDPDTLVFDTTYVDRMLKHFYDIKFTASFRQHPHYAMGLTYAVNGNAFDELLRDIERFPAHHEALENFEIAQRIFRLYGEESVARIPFGPDIDGGFYIGEPHDLPSKNGLVEEQLLKLGAYSCGWTYNATNPKEQAKYRLRQAEFMAKTLEFKLKEIDAINNIDAGTQAPAPTDP